MKKNWKTPKAIVEEFMPNEYCSACWGVACSIDNANKYDKKKNGIVHTLEHCGTLGNQVIKDYDENNIADAMIEVGTDGLGDLECEIFANGNYKKRISVADVSKGEYIYWTTTAKDGRTWHHQGKVEATFPGHPNRS